MIHQGSLIGMKQGRDDIEEARKDTECGLSFTKDPGFKEGDRIVCLNRRRVLPPLKWDLGF
jgi:translation initiation factor IF-2